MNICSHFNQNPPFCLANILTYAAWIFYSENTDFYEKYAIRDDFIIFPFLSTSHTFRMRTSSLFWVFLPRMYSAVERFPNSACRTVSGRQYPFPPYCPSRLHATPPQPAPLPLSRILVERFPKHDTCKRNRPASLQGLLPHRFPNTTLPSGTDSQSYTLTP